jgi:multisubunit Na+/H+ antiporter MnhG subunit
MSVLTRLDVFARDLIRKAKVRKGLVSVVAAFFILQLYFVRELIAAELIFLMLFLAILAVVGASYLLGTIGERGLEWTEVGVRAIAGSAKRGYVALEEVSKRPFRHPRSESAR